MLASCAAHSCVHVDFFRKRHVHHSYGCRFQTKCSPKTCTVLAAGCRR